jgi:hypothetical protein
MKNEFSRAPYTLGFRYNLHDREVGSAETGDRNVSDITLNEIDRLLMKIAAGRADPPKKKQTQKRRKKLAVLKPTLVVAMQQPEPNATDQVLDRLKRTPRSSKLLHRFLELMSSVRLKWMCKDVAHGLQSHLNVRWTSVPPNAGRGDRECLEFLTISKAGYYPPCATP